MTNDRGKPHGFDHPFIAFDEASQLSAEAAERLAEAVRAYERRVQGGRPTSGRFPPPAPPRFRPRMRTQSRPFGPAPAPTYADAGTTVHVVTTLPDWRARR